jgi:hypothetical protein
VPRGFLPVFSVGTPQEAEELLTLACPRNYRGQFVARELAEEQTLENLGLFGDHLRVAHERLKEVGRCQCKAVKVRGRKKRTVK